MPPYFQLLSNDGLFAVDTVQLLTYEYVDVNTSVAAGEEQSLLFQEPIRIFDPINRKWLCPVREQRSQRPQGLEGMSAGAQLIKPYTLASHRPAWRSLAEIAEQHLPMCWWVEPSLMKSRVGTKGKTVGEGDGVVLVGLEEPLTVKGPMRYLARNGMLYQDASRAPDFPASFDFKVTFK